MKPALIALVVMFAIVATPLAAADCVPDIRCDRPDLAEPACHAAWPTIYRANILAEQLVCS
jgi:hypothetical protein